MKFGLTEAQYQFITDTVAKPIRSLGNELYCFGSRSRNDHQMFSDLDLMIDGPKKCLFEISKIQETLSNSNFPYKVDLIFIEDMATAYLDNYYKERKIW